VNLLDFLFGRGEDLDALQMADRAIAVFALALVMIRLSGRRSFGQHRAFDGCATVLLGSVLSRAVVGASPFLPTIAAGVAICALHRLIAMASVRWAGFERLISGDKRELVRAGARDPDEMRRGLVTGRDLDEAVRRRTGDETAPLERAVLERDGTITVLARD
jgi:uncharacterized membrane protein YcaP (DUF421 family)